MTHIPATSKIWMPDAPPLVPHACDDEFEGVALDGKWSVWDVAAYQTRTVADGFLTISATGNNSGDQFGGIYQAIPGSEFAFYTHMAPIAAYTGVLTAGTFVSEDVGAAPSTADFRAIEQYVATSTIGTITRTWTQWSGGSQSQATNFSDYMPSYFRMRVNGTTIASDFSFDGISWVEMGSVTVGFTPTHFGLLFNQQNAALQHVKYKFARVFSGAGTSVRNATRIGRPANLVPVG